MTEQVFVDASAWIEAVDKKAPRHAEFRAALLGLEAELVTSDYVFDEAVTWILYKVGLRQAVETGEVLRGVVRLVHLTTEDKDEAWSEFKKQAPPKRGEGLSFTDCTSIVLMRRLGLMRIFSKDADFRQAGFDLVPPLP